MKRSPDPVPEVPVKVATVISTVAAACDGLVAVIDVLELTVKLTAATPPKKTPVAPVKPVPMIVTLVPPAVLPVLGETEVTVGAAAAL